MKERIDILLVERRLTESRTKAKWLVKNGFVFVNNIEVRKPGKRIDNKYKIELKKEFPYVGKGGLKLESALNTFSLNLEKKICVDIGASIGGFTDCLLKQGALKVYSIDIANDLLHPSLRCKKMKGVVIPLLGVDARSFIKLEEEVDICTIDITFSSLKEILPNFRNFLKSNGDIIALIKPIFEMEFKEIEKFPIINNPTTLKKILIDFIEWSIKNGFYPYGLIKSPILGNAGSIEFLIHLKINLEDNNFDYKKVVDRII